MRFIKQAIIFLFLFLGCSSVEQSKDSSTEDMEIRINPNSRQKEDLTLSEIIDSISYIPLETNENCLLGTIRRDFIYSENYILVNNTNSKLYLFNRTGNFIAQIGDIGAGPGEYLYAGTDIAYIDELNKQIAITIYPKRSIYYYDLKGKFIKSIPLPFEDVRGTIEYFNSFYIMQEANYYGKIPYTYTVLDTAFNIITQKIKPVQYSLKSGNMAFTAGPAFSRYIYNDQVHIRENMLNDTLYLVNNDFSFVPKYIINAGKYDVTVDIRSDDALRFLKEAKNCVILWSVFETHDYLFILYEYQNKRIPCYYHKKEKKVIHITSSSSGIPNDFDGGLDFWPVYQNNKEVVAIYDAYLFIEQKKNADNPKLQGSEKAIRRFGQMTQQLKADDNPVIVIVTLK